jgi:chorismate lyase/3-hydroxybenzoate synthase
MGLLRTTLNTSDWDKPEAPVTIAAVEPRPPRWVGDAMQGATALPPRSGIEILAAGHLLLASTIVEGAARLGTDAFREAVAGAYAAVGATLAANGVAAIRMWNYVPDPNALVAAGLDRYMVFNAGRRQGFDAWTHAPVHQPPPTASAIGVSGDDLWIHCLASSVPGRAVENPRQKPAWRYSARYGPVAPAFSRATLAEVAGRQRLLIGGTASIVGEDTAHTDDLRAQLEETLRNLAALVSCAGLQTEAQSRSLARITDVRAYVRRQQHAAPVHDELRLRSMGRTGLEIALAPLCRRELLVEIEGVAEIE